MKTMITWSIISHNQGQFVNNLLYSFRNLDYKNFEFIITINVQEDIKFLDKFKDFNIKLVKNNLIRGFGENHNRAFEISKGDFFVVINPDTDVGSLDIPHILTIFRNFKNIGALTVKCIDKFGVEIDHIRKFPNILVNFLRFFNLYNKDTIFVSDLDQIQKIDWASGSFLMFDKKIFKHINGFNEKFFMYFEDVDICRRLKIYGYDVLCTPKTSFIHMAQKNSRKKIKLFLIHLKSLLIYYNFNYNSISTSKITFICSSLSYFMSHRIPAYEAAIKNGLKASLVCNVDVDLNKIKDLEIDIHNIPWKRNSFNILNWLKNIYRLRKIMKDLHPNIIHCIALYTIFFYSLAFPFKRDKKINIYSVMGFGFLSNTLKKKKYLYFFTKLFFNLFGKNKNDFYQVQNVENKKLLIDFGINQDKIELIHGSGVANQNYKKNYNFKNFINIGFSGRLLKIKGLELLIEAFKEINKSEDNFKLYIAGLPDLLNPSSLTDIDIKKINKHDNIIFEGFVEDIGRFWRKIDIAILPSIYGEGLPKSLLEAASFGLPIITSDQEGCVDFADNEKNALVVKVNDHKDLYHKIINLSKDYKKRKKIGTAAQNIIKEKYSFEKIICKYSENYYKYLKIVKSPDLR